MESLWHVTRTGDRRASLEALRDLLAERIEAAEVKETAALAKQYADVLEQLANLPTGKEASAVDDLAARRAARFAASDVPPRTAEGDHGGSGGG